MRIQNPRSCVEILRRKNKTPHPMIESHHSTLIGCIGDAVAVERDIVNAVRTQLEDDRVRSHPELKPLFLDIAVHADHRADVFEKLIEQEGGSIGGAVKEGIAAVTGVLSGLYGMTRQHPLSKMVRDNLIAMNVASASYSILVTLALALDHKRAGELAASALTDCPKFALKLTDLLPPLLLEEISEDGPVLNEHAASQARVAIREARDNAER